MRASPSGEARDPGPRDALRLRAAPALHGAAPPAGRTVVVVRILILSRSRALYSTRRLVESAASAGHRALVVNPLDCWLLCGRGEPAVFRGEGRKRLGACDVAIPRVGGAAADYVLAVIDHLELLGVPLLNGATAIARARDKFRSLQFLAKHDVDVPRTIIARGPRHLENALRIVGGPPVVLKLIHGTQGNGVVLAETEEALESIVRTVWSLGHHILLQEYVAESHGRDIRALVVGNRVVAAMRRRARPGGFRSNIHRGGAGEGLRLPPRYERIAVEAARIMGLQLAGVDIVESRVGPKVIEVNSSPGFEGLEKATGVDVAAAIVRGAVSLRAEADASAGPAA